MTPNPFLGVGFHWIGGLAAASFYVAYRGVKRWSWETYWIVGGFFSWIVAPWVAALILTNHVTAVLSHAPGSAMFWAWFFGLLWGFGGLTFGLTVRYLGMSLGYGVALGICAVCGTLIPPLFKGQLPAIAASTPGKVTLLGVGVCVIGIMCSALAGLSKERELPAAAKQATVTEFDFKKGLLVALFCGIMSACMAFGLDAGEPLAQLSAGEGTSVLWTGLPKLVVVLFGGFCSNAAWCLILTRRNRTGSEFLAGTSAAGEPVPRLGNLFFSALAGVTWYLQFFFYTMGETQMGRFHFSSWTLHMASIIIFSTLWGIALKEWIGTSQKTKSWIAAGIVALILSTLVVGYGNYLAARTSAPVSEIEGALTQALAGDWVGVLEYRDYSEPSTSMKRVQLPTWLTITPTAEGLRRHFVYDDGPTKTVEDTDTVTLAVGAGTGSYTEMSPGKPADIQHVSGYEKLKNGRGDLTLTGTTTDQNAPAETRTTLTIRRNLLAWTLEVRPANTSEPFTFRHRFTFTRAAAPHSGGQ